MICFVNKVEYKVCHKYAINSTQFLSVNLDMHVLQLYNQVLWSNWAPKPFMGNEDLPFSVSLSKLASWRIEIYDLSSL